jgi:hypothetical protein
MPFNIRQVRAGFEPRRSVSYISDPVRPGKSSAAIVDAPESVYPMNETIWRRMRLLGEATRTARLKSGADTVDLNGII